MPFNSETRINTYATGDQTDVTVTRLSDGSFVDVWTSAGQDGSGKGVYMRHYDASGNSLSAETLVNTTTTNNQYLPTVSSLGNGGFVVGWSSTGQDGSSDGIFLQRFDSNAVAVGTETRANVYTAGSQSASHVASLSDGGYIAVWNSVGQDGAQGGIYARQFNSSGVAVGGEIHVSTTTADNQYQPTVTGLPGGGSVVVWSANGQDGSDLGVFMQRFDSAGHAVGTETQVNTYTSLNQFDPSVVALNDGGFLVTWDSHAQDSSFYGVYGQRYDASGVATGAEFRVSGTTAYGQQISSAAAMPDGGFVMTWQSGHQDGSGWGIYAERFDAAGHAVGGEVLVNHTTTGDQVKPHVAAIDADHYVVTWTGPDGDGTGVFQNVIDASSVPLSGGGIDDVLGHGEITGNPFDMTAVSVGNDRFALITNEPSAAFGIVPGAKFQVVDAAGHAVGSQTVVDAHGTVATGAGLANGDFVMTWANQTGVIEGQIFHSDGSAASGMFEIESQFSSATEHAADVTDLGNGRFVEVHADATTHKLEGTIRDASTGSVENSFTINNTSSSAYASPSLIKVAGGFAVAWYESGEDHFKIFDTNGIATSAEQQLSMPLPSGSAGTITHMAALQNGGFAIEYANSDSAGTPHLFVQTLSSSGSEQVLFEVSGAQNGFGDSYSIAANGAGNLVVTWSGQDTIAGNGGTDIFAREYAVNGTQLGQTQIVSTPGTNFLSDTTALSDGHIATAWNATSPVTKIEWSILG